MLQKILNIFNRGRISSGNSTAGVKILEETKLYRDIRFGNTIYRGSDDETGGQTDYIFEFLSEDAIRNKTILDLGSAGGAFCFNAVKRGAAFATGVEHAERRIRGAIHLKKIFKVKNVEFVKEDFYRYLYRKNKLYDVVFALNIFHHFRNPYPLLQRICRACRDYIVIECPRSLSVDKYGGDYCPGLVSVEGVREAKTIDDLIAYLKIFYFELVNQGEAKTERKFFLNETRFVYVFRYQYKIKDKVTRKSEMLVYRKYRTESDMIFESHPNFIEFNSTEEVLSILKVKLGNSFSSYNFLIAGGRGSGKTSFYNQLPTEYKYPYEAKIFRNKHDRLRLWRHLIPFGKYKNKFAIVMLGPSDDDVAHCTVKELVSYIRNRKVVCLLLCPTYDVHFETLYNRERDRINRVDRDIDFDYSIRFDCRRYVDAFEKNGVKYFILRYSGDEKK